MPSLAGVAIAAALLPPAVNGGMCLAVATARTSAAGRENPRLYLEIAGASGVQVVGEGAAASGMKLRPSLSSRRSSSTRSSCA